jgi:hypothetical protein
LSLQSGGRFECGNNPGGFGVGVGVVVVFLGKVSWWSVAVSKDVTKVPKFLAENFSPA